jgi:hypothetical protein
MGWECGGETTGCARGGIAGGVGSSSCGLSCTSSPGLSRTGLKVSAEPEGGVVTLVTGDSVQRSGVPESSWSPAPVE